MTNVWSFCASHYKLHMWSNWLRSESPGTIPGWRGTGNLLSQIQLKVYLNTTSAMILLVWVAILHIWVATVCPKKYAHGFCFAVLCCGYTLTDFPISIRLTSLALWQSSDCPSASKATLMNVDKYFMWIHYERLHNHNKAKHNKTVCIFLGIYCKSQCYTYYFS